MIQWFLCFIKHWKVVYSLWSQMLLTDKLGKFQSPLKTQWSPFTCSTYTLTTSTACYSLKLHNITDLASKLALILQTWYKQVIKYGSGLKKFPSSQHRSDRYCGRVIWRSSSLLLQVRKHHCYVRKCYAIMLHLQKKQKGIEGIIQKNPENIFGLR